VCAEVGCLIHPRILSGVEHSGEYQRTLACWVCGGWPKPAIWSSDEVVNFREYRSELWLEIARVSTVLWFSTPASVILLRWDYCCRISLKCEHLPAYTSSLTFPNREMPVDPQSLGGHIETLAPGHYRARNTCASSSGIRRRISFYEGRLASLEGLVVTQIRESLNRRNGYTCNPPKRDSQLKLISSRL